ncbi:MAG TPA: hypothetical protein VJY62_03285 [Bacteroidia bacterium]|nr:hypothetical protein [Bacteroidia bacterium]
MSEILCKILGHNWHYKDYTHAMQPDGTPFPYTESRRCFRCNVKFVRIEQGEWMEPPPPASSKRISVENALK